MYMLASKHLSLISTTWNWTSNWDVKENTHTHTQRETIQAWQIDIYLWPLTKSQAYAQLKLIFDRAPLFEEQLGRCGYNRRRCHCTTSALNLALRRGNRITVASSIQMKFRNFLKLLPLRRFIWFRVYHIYTKPKSEHSTLAIAIQCDESGSSVISSFVAALLGQNCDTISDHSIIAQIYWTIVVILHAVIFSWAFA